MLLHVLIFSLLWLIIFLPRRVASIVEIILFMLLLKNQQYTLLKGAILGSILANLLLCLGCCFIASGVRRPDATFDETISEAGSGLLLTAYIDPNLLFPEPLLTIV